MLAEIYIRNYILVPELRIRFESGLTVITGETGAGKSILVGSVALIFGDSAAGLEAYDPSSPIYLETSFIPNQDPLLREYLNQINADWEEELVLAREISVNGKSSYFVGGRKVSAQVLKNLKPLLLDFHHQRDQQKLLSAAYQLELLDRYADSTGLCADFAMAFKELKSKQRQLQEMQKQEEMQQQRLELYRYQYAELEKADIQAGEDTDLQQEFELQSHGKEIQELALGMNLALMESENSIVDQLGQFQAQLEHYRRLNPQIEDAASLLVEATEALRNTAQTLSSLTDNISFDPGRLSYLESRLDTINNLLYKHRVHNVEELLQLFQKRQKEIASADDFQQQIIALQEAIAIGMQELAQKADKLSAIRRTAALALAEELQNSIRQLALAQSSIQIRIDKNAASENVMTNAMAAFTESGQDAVEILFSANSGSSLKPLVHVASGGELSRILLGIKQVLSQRMYPKLLILDEIDSGVGGKTAELMASAIACIAQQHPILCVTHLAQIAAYANTHIAVEKKSEIKTSVTLSVLNPAERIRELARMLSGNITQHALKHAEELIIKQRKDLREQNQ